MVAQFAGPSDGWADLAAFAGFVMLGAIGLGVGLLVDLVHLTYDLARLIIVRG